MRGKVPYYYLVTSARVNGKPRLVEQIYLGPVSRMADIAKFFNDGGLPDPTSSDYEELGAVLALYNLADRLKISEIIDRFAKKRDQGLPVSDYILLAAINRVVDSTSKNHFFDWFKATVLYQVYPQANQKNLSAQAFWNNMKHLDKEKIYQIEDEITRTVVSAYDISTDCLLFDNTNFFTYIDTETPGELGQRGHCKSKRTDLKIVGLSLMVSPDHNIPLFHETYPGNRNDAKQFSLVAKSLKDRYQKLNPSQDPSFTLVFDRGNNSDVNVKEFLVSKGFHVVGGLRMNQCLDLIKIPKSEFVPLTKYGLEGVTAYRVTRELYESQMAVIVTYNPELYNAQLAGVESNIINCKSHLSDIQGKLQLRIDGTVTKGKKPTEESVKLAISKVLSAEHMGTMFNYTIVNNDGKVALEFSLNQENYQTLLTDVLGKSILFTDHLDWETSKIVSTYRSQYHVEECFRQMKDTKHLTFRPIRHFTDDNIRVHSFYCVLALLLASVLNKEFDDLGHSMSINHMIDILNQVKRVQMTFKVTEKKEVKKSSIAKLSQPVKEYFDKYGVLDYLK
jgi:transposase